MPEKEAQQDGGDTVPPSETETVAEPEFKAPMQRPREGKTEVKVRGSKEETVTKEVKVEQAEKLPKKAEAELAQRAATDEVKEGAPPRQEEFIVLTPEQGVLELARILVESSAR